MGEIRGISMTEAARQLDVTPECIRLWLADPEHPLYGQAVQYGPKTIRLLVEPWERFRDSRPKYVPKLPKSRKRKDPAAPAA